MESSSSIYSEYVAAHAIPVYKNRYNAEYFDTLAQESDLCKISESENIVID